MCDLQDASALYKRAAAAYTDINGSSDHPDVIECEMHALRVRWHAGVVQEVPCLKMPL